MPAALAKDVVVKLPPGFIGDPTAYPVAAGAILSERVPVGNGHRRGRHRSP